MKALKEVLGMNSRNVNFIAPHNKKSDFHLVDNKLETKKVLEAAGLPTPKLITFCEWFWEVDRLPKKLRKENSFVVKPARGMAGGGIIIIAESKENGWSTVSGEFINSKNLVNHCRNILYGVYSIDNTTDIVLVEEKLVQHAFFNAFYDKGIADIRLILYKGQAIMAMCRIPTKKSDGKANVTLGAIGAGIDMASGTITHAVTKQGPLSHHPDSNTPLVGTQIPFWKDIREIGATVQHHFPLGYLGVDIVLDERKGPQILELNARPGLEIQNANKKGLRGILEEIHQ